MVYSNPVDYLTLHFLSPDVLPFSTGWKIRKQIQGPKHHSMRAYYTSRTLLRKTSPTAPNVHSRSSWRKSDDDHQPLKHRNEKRQPPCFTHSSRFKFVCGKAIALLPSPEPELARFRIVVEALLQGFRRMEYFLLFIASESS